MSEQSRGRGKSEQKRLQIMEAAGGMFLDSGFEGASMEAIAAAANVSKQTVYSHFTNKEELFSAVIEQECARHQLTESLFDPEKPVAEVLLSLAEHFNELLLSDSAICLNRVCVTSAEQRSSIAALYWEAGPAKLKARLEHYLQQQVTREVLNIPDLPFASQQFLFMVKGETQQRKLFGLDVGNKAHQQAYLKSCVELFLSAYQIKG